MFAARPMSTFYGVADPIPILSVVESNQQSHGSNGAGIWFNGDGRLFLNTDISSVPFPAQNWYGPTTAGVGNNYWVRLTVTDGSAPTAGLSDPVGTWNQITVAVRWYWSRGTAGTTTATVTLELATDNAGSNIVATKTGITVSCTY